MWLDFLYGKPVRFGINFKTKHHNSKLIYVFNVHLPIAHERRLHQNLHSICYVNIKTSSNANTMCCLGLIKLRFGEGTCAAFDLINFEVSRGGTLQSAFGMYPLYTSL